MSSLARTAAKVTFSALERLRAPVPGPRILIYHQIGAGHGRELDVSPTVFAQQLDWLQAEGLVVVPLEEAIDRRGHPEAARLVVLTFDDGYADMYRNGLPALVDRRLPFTLYLTTEPTETGRGLASERLSTPLTWDQVNSIKQTGLATIAAHTHAHRDLRHLEPDDIARDLDTSNRLIAERTGTAPDHFAYPWGYWSPVADRLVRERYASAVLGGGAGITGETDPLMLNRIPIQLSDGLRFFTHKVRRGQRTEESVRRRISGYEGP